MAVKERIAERIAAAEAKPAEAEIYDAFGVSSQGKEAAKIVCTLCGMVLEPAARFCPVCGTKVKG